MIKLLIVQGTSVNIAPEFNIHSFVLFHAYLIIVESEVDDGK